MQKNIIGSIMIQLADLLYKRRENSPFSFCLFKFYSCLIKATNRSIYRIVSFDEYSLIEKNCNSWTIASNRRGATSKLHYLDELDSDNLYLESLPVLKMHRLNDVVIGGNSDLIIDTKRNLIINDFCAALSDNNIMMIDGLLYRSKNRVGIVRGHNQRKMVIKEGIMINGKFSNNYYHNILENFSRMIYINNENIPSNIPIIVDEPVRKVPSFEKIVKYLNTTNREIIYISPESVYQLSTLYYIDHPHYIVPHRSKRILSNPKDYVYDVDSIELMRNRLMRYVNVNSVFPKRVFISRNNAKYRKFNEDEIFNLLEPLGFQKIFPELLTFEEQVNLFNNAEFIMSATGAALTNLLFCSRGCKVICFGSSKRGYEPHIFNTIAHIVGCKIWYVAPDVKDERTSVHNDFHVNINEIKVQIFNIVNQ